MDQMQLRQEACREYCGSYIYEDGMLSQILVDGGYISPVYSTGKFPMRPNPKNYSSEEEYQAAMERWQERVKNSKTIKSFNYFFYITDHLGNNRVVAKANGIPRQVNDYYPFGGLMGESFNGDAQRYKYNGKELDRMNGLDIYDYGARMYDGRRFTTVDPLAEKYYSISPYAYCANNPVNAIDINGDSIYFDIPTIENGEITGYTRYTYGKYGDTYGFGRNGELYNGDNTTINAVADALDSYTGGLDVNGNNYTEPFINLGHELIHAKDYIEGTVNRTAWFTTPSGKVIPYAEHEACVKENILRAENGFPLRKYYSNYENSNKPYLPSLIINPRCLTNLVKRKR